jgi:hypothetical protein
MKDGLSETALLEAIENLQLLEHKDPSLGETARRLRIQLRKMLEGDLSADPAPELQDFAAAVEKSPRRKKSQGGGKFQTPIFKCLDEHRLCLEKNYPSGICIGLAAACIMRHLIPFLPNSN